MGGVKGNGMGEKERKKTVEERNRKGERKRGNKKRCGKGGKENVKGKE